MSTIKPYCIILMIMFSLSYGLHAQPADSNQYSSFVEKDIAAEYSDFKNTSIELRLPKHFTKFENENLSGYMHKGTASSIVASERTDAPFMLTQDSIRPEQITGMGVELVSQQDVKTYDGAPAKVFLVEFTVKEVPVRRIMFFTGNYNKTVFLQANYPKGFDKLLRTVIIESFRTVKFDS